MLQNLSWNFSLKKHSMILGRSVFNRTLVYSASLEFKERSCLAGNPCQQRELIAVVALKGENKDHVTKGSIKTERSNSNAHSRENFIFVSKKGTNIPRGADKGMFVCAFF